MQKRSLALLTVLLLLPALALAGGPARHSNGHGNGHGNGRGHGHGHGHGHRQAHHQPRSSVHFGLSFGNGFYHPGYYPNYWYGPSVTYSAPIYTPPPVVIQTQPPVYIERPTAVAEAPAAAYWHYCAPTQSYYPYVSECSEAWQRVSPVPPETQP